MFHILSESAADLSREQIEYYNIKIIPMYISLNGKVYRDGSELSQYEMFEYVNKTGIYPKTAAPSVEDYKKFFSIPGEKIFIGLSSKLSSAFQNAVIASKELNDSKLMLINSKSLSTGIGQIVIKAAELRNQGASGEDTFRETQKFVEKGRGILFLESLDYIFKGGRVAGINKFMGSILKILPILELKKDGSLGLHKLVRGTRKKAINLIADLFKTNETKIDAEKFYITHLDCNDEAIELKTKLHQVFPKAIIEINSVGCLLAAHSGSKPFGIAYKVK